METQRLCSLKLLAMAKICLITLSFEMSLCSYIDVGLSIREYYESKCIIGIELSQSDNEKLIKSLSKNYVPSMAISWSQLLERRLNYKLCSMPMFVVNGWPMELRENIHVVMSEVRSIWLINLDHSLDLEKHYEFATRIDSLVLVMNMSSSSFVEIKRLSRISCGNALIITNYFSWERHMGLIASRPKVNERYFNIDMNGLFLTAATVGSESIVSFRRNKDGELTPTDGLYYHIWSTITDKLKITYNITMTGKDESFVGARIGNWSGLIGKLLKREIDVILTEITYTSERSHVAKFTHSIMTSKVRVYVRPSDHEGIIWSAPFKPFESDVWLALLFWIVFASISFFTCATIYVAFDMAQESFFADLSLTKGLFFVLQSLCQQGSDKLPRAWSFRALFLTSYVTSSVLLPYYSASLVSSLTQRTTRRPFDTLSEMKDSSYRLLANRDSSDYDLLMGSNLPAFQAIVSTKLDLIPGSVDASGVPSFWDSFKHICKVPNLAVMADEILFDYEYFYSNYWSNCEVVKLDDGDLPISHLGMALHHDSPYADLINYWLLRMREAGLMDRLKTKYLLKGKQAVPDSTKFTPVSWKSVAPVTVCLITGGFLAVGIFIGEVVGCWLASFRRGFIHNILANEKNLL